MVEDYPGYKTGARRSTLLAGVADADGLTPQDTAAIPGLLEAATAQRRQGSFCSRSGNYLACTRRGFLMLNAALIGAIAPGRPVSAQAASLPFFGQYYGNATFGHNSANTQLTSATELGTSFFFYAERTGVIDQIFWHRRTGPGYSLGDGGRYTIEIRAANPVTKIPRTGVSAICRVDNILPGNPGNAFVNFITNFTIDGQVTAKQPYCLIWRNTHVNPGNNYFSSNINWHHIFFDRSDPANYQEPAGADPVNPGTSPTPVRGWTPAIIDGTINWYPWPAKARNGSLHYTRLGPEFTSLRYSDGQWTGFGSWGSGGNYRAQVGRGTANMARERFRVTRANRVVRGVFIRIPRYNGTTGNLIVRLERGPASDTAGNGTLIEQVSVPHTAIYDVGNLEDEDQDSASEVVDFVPFLWVPFSQNRTLSVGTIYNLRLSATGNLDCRMWCTARTDDQGLGPRGSSLTWAQHEAQRQVPWNCWEDSRGFMVSTNSGSSWSFFVGRLSPILFKCVVS
jgi:hypothetical protein